MELVMKVFGFVSPSYLITLTSMLTLSAFPLQAAERRAVASQLEPNIAVTVTDQGSAWTLDNGIVEATISKGDGRMHRS
jgi:hypothetical protein